MSIYNLLITQNYKNMNNMFSKPANDSLVSTKTNTR